ncbi:MAG: GIY-YIG nuclease family protein [Williamsia sp.]|nr:GIY-YIG nuclease family protein [Williamsia sp.]
MNEHFHVYIAANKTRTVLYTGVTNNLPQRIIEHYLNRGNTRTFTGRYNCYHLLYHESFQYINGAIARKKEIKNLSRRKKSELISAFNPHRQSLNQELFDKWPPDDLFHRKDLE